MPLDTAHLATLAAVVHEGSFDAAAQALHVTPSAVSQRIKALEHAVGQVLVLRTKPCTVTEAGQPLLRLAGQVALLEDEALRTVRGSGGGPSRGRIAVAVNADSLGSWFVEAVAALPPELGVTVDLREDDQDHTADWLRDGTVMAAVTAQNVAVQGCRVQRLGVMRYLAVTSPDLARRCFPDGPSASSLAEAPMLVFDRKDRMQDRFVRSVTRRRLDPPVHYVPAVAAFAEALRLGLGWGMEPEQLAAPDLDAGRLVDIGRGRHLDVPLHWQHWRMESAVLAALTASVRSVAGRVLR